jgi:rRNA maturation endonuclease Nob1
MSGDKLGWDEMCPHCEMPRETSEEKRCPYCGTVLVDKVLDMDEEGQSRLVDDLKHGDHNETE